MELAVRHDGGKGEIQIWLPRHFFQALRVRPVKSAKADGKSKPIQARAEHASGDLVSLNVIYEARAHDAPILT